MAIVRKRVTAEAQVFLWAVVGVPGERSALALVELQHQEELQPALVMAETQSFITVIPVVKKVITLMMKGFLEQTRMTHWVLTWVLETEMAASLLVTVEAQVLL